MANGQPGSQSFTQNDLSGSHAHMPTYGGSTNGAEPRIPGTAKAPVASHHNSTADVSSNSMTSSSTSLSSTNEAPTNVSKAWNFGDGNDSASSVNVPPTDSASSVNAPAVGKAQQEDRIQTPTQEKPQPQQNGQDEGNKTALGASQASTGKEGERAAQPAEDEGGAAKGEAGEADGGDAAPTQPEGGYPEQLHAGRLEGLGPEYAKSQRVTLADRLGGVKEQIKGTIKRDPELKQQGKERMTGELKRKQREEEQGTDPFQNAEEDKKDDDKKDGDKKDDDRMDEDEPPRPNNIKADPNKTTTDDETGVTQAPQVHPTDKGREEQAASVQPEGTEPSTREKRARSNVESAGAS